MNSQKPQGNSAGSVPDARRHAFALLTDELVRARAAISELERIAKIDVSWGRKCDPSFANIWAELDLIEAEIAHINAQSA